MNACQIGLYNLETNEIHNYFIEINENEPEEIENWKNIAFDENEFVEIQNQWKSE